MKIKFIDKNKSLVELEIKTKGYISFRADYQNRGGQCNDRINPDTKEQKLLLNLWKKYHSRKNYPLHLEAIIKKLADIISKEFRENIIDNKQSDEELLKIVQSLDSKFDDNFYIACIKNFELSINDLEEISLESEDYYLIQGNEYLICDDEAADEYLDEYLENYIDDCVLFEIPEHYQKYFDREEFKRDYSKDGRGSHLNFNNGREENQTVFGETFYFYRRSQND